MSDEEPAHTEGDPTPKRPVEPGGEPRRLKHPLRHRTWRREFRTWERTVLAEAIALSAMSDEREATANQLKGRLREIEAERDKLKTGIVTTQRLDAIGQEIAALNSLTEQARTEMDLGVPRVEQLKSDLDRLLARQRERNRSGFRLTRGMAWISVAVSLLSAISTLAEPFGGISGGIAHLHIEFYESVALIAPALLVAGFVEVTALKMPHAALILLGFAIPTVTAGATALYVLGTHNPTGATGYASVLELGDASLLLLTYAMGHAATNEPND